MSGGASRFRKQDVLGVLCVAAGPVAIFTGFRTPDEAAAVLYVLGGMLSPVVGFVLLVPTLLAWAARGAERLPPLLRTTPPDEGHERPVTAVSMILVIVAGFTTVAVGVASDMRAEALDHGQRLPRGHTLVQELDARTAPLVLGIVDRELPGVPVARIDRISRLFDQDRRWFGYVQDGDPCAIDPCDDGRWRFPGILVADPDEARFLIGDAPEALSALASGRAVVYPPGVVHGGTARFETGEWTGEWTDGVPGREKKVSKIFEFPAVHTTPVLDGVPDVVLPRTLAAATGLEVEPAMLLIGTPPGEEAGRRLDNAASLISDTGADVYTERGVDHSENLLLLAVAVVGTAVLALIVALLETGPSARRAGSVSLRGWALGLLAGAPAGAAAGLVLTWPWASSVGPSHGPLIDVPWLLLLGSAVAASLAAALAADVGAALRGRRKSG